MYSKRVSKIDDLALYQIIVSIFEEHGKNKNISLDLIDIVVVGSFLSRNFQEEESDLDIILLVDSNKKIPQKYKEEFLHYCQISKGLEDFSKDLPVKFVDVVDIVNLEEEAFELDVYSIKDSVFRSYKVSTS